MANDREKERERERSVDVAVVGAGTAGLAAYRAAVARGASALLVEAGPGGTTCARVGCMPSKLLIAAADAAHRAADAGAFGVRTTVAVDGAAVIERVRRRARPLRRLRAGERRRDPRGAPDAGQGALHGAGRARRRWPHRARSRGRPGDRVLARRPVRVRRRARSRGRERSRVRLDGAAALGRGLRRWRHRPRKPVRRSRGSACASTSSARAAASVRSRTRSCARLPARQSPPTS